MGDSSARSSSSQLRLKVVITWKRKVANVGGCESGRRRMARKGMTRGRGFSSRATRRAWPHFSVHSSPSQSPFNPSTRSIGVTHPLKTPTSFARRAFHVLWFFQLLLRCLVTRTPHVRTDLDHTLTPPNLLSPTSLYYPPITAPDRRSASCVASYRRSFSHCQVALASTLTDAGISLLSRRSSVPPRHSTHSCPIGLRCHCQSSNLLAVHQ